MEQIISTLYQENEQYHHVKEKMTWLAATIYLFFWAGYLKWILTDKLIGSVWYLDKCCTVILLVLISAIAIIFIGHQNWKKAESVRKTVEFHNVICQLDVGITYSQLIAVTKCKMGSIQGNLSSDERVDRVYGY